MKTLRNSMLIGILLIATSMMSQTQEVEFEVYSNSAAKASRYLLANDVAMRAGPSVQFEQLTTLQIGTYLRLLAKSESPQTIKGVCSRWYKVKIGPDLGWIWGGMIAQKTMVSSLDPETIFLFGEAEDDFNSQKQYQIRAVKNGVELDRLVFRSQALDYEKITLEKTINSSEVIKLVTLASDSLNIKTAPIHVIWKDSKLQQQSTLTVAVETVELPPNVFCMEQ